MKKIYADQDLPSRLMKGKLLHKNQYKELLTIINKNIPNISVEDTIELIKKISSTGCSCAMAANSLVDQIYNDDETFKNMFGFSLLSNQMDSIDCNKLMVDIFSKLYGIVKVKFIEYETYSFNSVEEAALNLLGKQFDTVSLASVALFNNGIISNGVDSNNKLLFRTKSPKITDYVGTCTQIAQEKFGIQGVKTLEELKKISDEKNICFEYSDLEIYQKLTGLGTQNFNFWINYYLNQYNVDFNINKESIIVADFKDNYNEFIRYLNELVLKGYSISVSAGPNSNSYMHTKLPMSWGKISSEQYGHVMLFKGFNKSNDIVVSSYGKDYIIPKEYFANLEYGKIIKTNKEMNEQKSR